jgi:hypothetical protein
LLHGGKQTHTLCGADVDQVGHFVTLHGIGKIGISDVTKLKCGPFAEVEELVIVNQVELGFANKLAPAIVPYLIIVPQFPR